MYRLVHGGLPLSGGAHGDVGLFQSVLRLGPRYLEERREFQEILGSLNDRGLALIHALRHVGNAPADMFRRGGDLLQRRGHFLR